MEILGIPVIVFLILWGLARWYNAEQPFAPRCPACKEPYNRGAAKCCHCGTDIPSREVDCIPEPPESPRPFLPETLEGRVGVMVFLIFVIGLFVWALAPVLCSRNPF